LFTKDDAKRLRTLVPALNKVLADHGFAMTMDGSISIGSVQLSTKVTFAPVAKDGVDPLVAAKAAARAQFDRKTYDQPRREHHRG